MPNYRRNTYDLVVDSTFRPFSMQEMLQPLVAYKEEYDKRENDYLDLVDKSDKFKYLSETLPEGSRSRQIYEGYANELNKQAEDLAKHGLSMGNRRSLMNLKRRYQGEIGRLMSADEAMQEEKKLRRANKDTSMLYALDNLSIDDFLDNNTPNLYGVSGDELYKRGAQAGASASSRIYDNTQVSDLTKYYQEITQKMGYSPERLAEFRSRMEAIPELQQAVDDILQEKGVTDNLTGSNYERARQSVVNGILDGAQYKEAKSVKDNPGVLTAAQADASARGWAGINLQRENRDFERAISGYEKDGNGNWVYNPKKDQAVQKAKAVAEAKDQGKGSSGVAYDTRNKEMTMIGAKTGSKYKHQDDDKSIGQPLETAGNMRALTAKEYSQLIDAYGNITNDYVRNAIGNGRLSDYEIYIIPSGSTKIDGSGWIWDDSTDEDIYVIKPRESKRAATDYTGNVETSGYGGGFNDIPD